MRVINGKPVTLAQLREAVGVIRGLASGAAVEYRGSTLRLPWTSGTDLPIWMAAYGAEGAGVDG